MHRIGLLRRLALAVVGSTALAIPVGLATSASAAATPVTWHVRVGTESPDMAVSAMAFLPKEVWVDAGDTVHWTAGSAEPHTVTFLAPGSTLQPFDPFDPSQVARQGGGTEDGTAYRNSGIMATQPIFTFTDPAAAYDLTFPRTGDFTYYCLVHGAMMSGTVHVRAAGTAYPYTQQDYDRVGNAQAATALAAGRDAWRQSRQDHATTGPSVEVGVDGDGFSVMRFVRDHVVVHVGDTVAFSTASEAPHTVTFGQEPPGLGILFPSGDPAHYAGGDLNSGLLAAGVPFSVTFTSVGTFHYICAIHDDMGMVGDVVVEP